MSRRTRHTAWISALLALFMVLVLPVCWAGALIQAQKLGVAGSPSPDGNEEREEHEERDVEVREAQERRRAPSAPSTTVPERRRVAFVAPRPVVASFVSVVEPSRYSVRRLL